MPRLGAFVLSNYFAVIYVPVYSEERHLLNQSWRSSVPSRIFGPGVAEFYGFSGCKELLAPILGTCNRSI